MDIGELRALPAQAPALGLQLRSGDATRRALHLRLYRRGDPLAMSDLLPMLENFDLRVQNERPYRIASDADPGLWIQDLEVTHAGGQTLDPGAVGRTIRAGVLRGLERAARRATASTGWCSPPGSTGARPWSCARCAATCCRPACPSASATWSRFSRASPSSRSG